MAHIYVLALQNEVHERWTHAAACSLLDHWLTRQPDLAFGAQCDNNLIGAFVVGIRPWWDGNHLVDGELFVHPQFQNQGVARALMRCTLQTAIEKYNPVLWESYTFKDQQFPLDWYKRIGFSEIDEWVMIRAQVSTVAAKLGCAND